MRTITLALGSFIVGALCMSLFGNHISTVRQSGLAFAQMPEMDEVWQAAVPKVPPLGTVSSSHNTFLNRTVGLDGFRSSNNVYKGVKFVYGGGAYQLTSSVIAPPVQFEFVGAAANTVGFLNTFGMIGCPAKPQPPEVNPNTPIINKASLEKELKGDFVSPYSGTK